MKNKLYTPENLGRTSKEAESPYRLLMGSNMFNPKNSHMRTPDKIQGDRKMVLEHAGMMGPHMAGMTIDVLQLVPPEERPKMKSMKVGGK